MCRLLLHTVLTVLCKYTLLIDHQFTLYVAANVESCVIRNFIVVQRVNACYIVITPAEVPVLILSVTRITKCSVHRIIIIIIFVIVIIIINYKIILYALQFKNISSLNILVFDVIMFHLLLMCFGVT